MSIARTDTYLGAKYRRLARRIGKQKALLLSKALNLRPDRRPSADR
jgi:hypothetical protein